MKQPSRWDATPTLLMRLKHTGVVFQIHVWEHMDYRYRSAIPYCLTGAIDIKSGFSDTSGQFVVMYEHRSIPFCRISNVVQ
jgi:hypothetical protein